ncbi:MAG: SxtJ family membrane protein [Alphaproteobacteria bacterium]
MADNGTTHESFDRNESVEGSSNRAFGIVFTVVFAIIGLWPLPWGDSPHWWALVIAAVFLLTALIIPKSLAPLNRAWMRFGLLLHKVVNPLIMGLVFFLTVTPTALIMRALGKDPLKRRLDKDATTYWIDRTPPGPDPDSMPRQF